MLAEELQLKLIEVDFTATRPKVKRSRRKVLDLPVQQLQLDFNNLVHLSDFQDQSLINLIRDFILDPEPEVYVSKTKPTVQQCLLRNANWYRTVKRNGKAKKTGKSGLALDMDSIISWSDYIDPKGYGIHYGEADLYGLYTNDYYISTLKHLKRYMLIPKDSFNTHPIVGQMLAKRKGKV